MLEVLLTLARFGFVHLDTAAGAFIINGRIRDNNIAGNRVVIAKIFVDVGSSNLACCNSAAEEIEGAVAEGAELYGLKSPHHIEADENGNVAALWVEPQIIGPIDAWGRARPIHADVELERIPCDVIVVAIGQGIELRPFEEAGIKIKRGTISALSSSELANNEGVFAGGDAVTGAATVILAMGAGKRAAAAMDEYIKNKNK